MQPRSPAVATPIASRPPVSLTSLVGREREILDLSALVRAQRLVTLTGVGGSGKTRLAAELALRIDWQRADSVAWVELAPCTDPLSVPQATASALSLRVTQQCELIDAIVDALRDRELLLVLDDCEHLIVAAAELARALLVRCPKLHILATSREPLGVAGEHVWPVPPIAPEEAVQLFVERAAAVNPSLDVQRTPTTSANGWTAFRSPSSWRQRACACSRRSRSRQSSKIDSRFSPAARARPFRGIARCARRSTGASRC
ncbi:MAG TPA: AAA family ATPase [Thermoanaerobaculia bacterium]|nr:AAA family ATPase [Thermoanaerobaculia bacterium]